MATEYEWIVEEIAEDGEVWDVFSFDSLTEALENMGEGDILALRKMKSNSECDSVDDMAYAYVKNGVLPVEFDDGKAVPKKFHKEFEKFYKNA